MNVVIIRPISKHQCHLGEGPLWDPVNERLYWVDSLAPRLYCQHFHSGAVQYWDLPGQTVGSVAVCREAGLVLAMDTRFWHFDPASGDCEPLTKPITDVAGVRLNDGKVDPHGSFVSGTMNVDDWNQTNGCMYRLTPDGRVETLLEGFFCFNGPCFSPDGQWLYVSGRQGGQIERFAYSHDGLQDGGPWGQALIPDGATVDAAGYIWSAQWARGCILRLSPEGEVVMRVEIDNEIVTSVMFGGPCLDRIYVTTVGGKVADYEPRYSGAGRVYCIEASGFTGRPESFFG